MYKRWWGAATRLIMLICITFFCNVQLLAKVDSAVSNHLLYSSKDALNISGVKILSGIISGNLVWILALVLIILTSLAYILIKIYTRKLISKNKKLKKLLNKQKNELEHASKEIERLSIVARETENAITIFDSEGRIEWANDSFTKIYGYSINEYIDAFGDNIYASSYNKNIKEIIDKGIKNREAVIYDYKAITKNKRDIWIQTTLTPIYNSKKLYKLVAIDTDITQLKEMQKNLQNKTNDFQEINSLLLKQKKDLQAAQEEMHLINEMLETEKKKSDTLLLNILPEITAEELKKHGKSEPRHYDKTTILFTDFANFSRTSKIRPFEEIIEELDYCFAAFDDIIEKYNIEKIKTMGDSYMCVGGIPKENNSNPIDLVLAGLEMANFINKERRRRDLSGSPFFSMRLGIHTGKLLAGVVGKKKFAYDVWGEAVNLARFMEISGKEDFVNISQATHSYIKEFFNCTSRGKIGIKHSGMVEMYLVNGLKEDYAADASGIFPNEKMLEEIEKIKNSSGASPRAADIPLLPEL